MVIDKQLFFLVEIAVIAPFNLEQHLFQGEWWRTYFLAKSDATQKVKYSLSINFCLDVKCVGGAYALQGAAETETLNLFCFTDVVPENWIMNIFFLFEHS